MKHPDSVFAISGDEINMQKKKLPGGEPKILLTKFDSARRRDSDDNLGSLFNQDSYFF